MNKTQIRNIIAEVVTIAGIADAALPQLAATVHVPAWAGVTLAFIANVGNQVLKQFFDAPPAPPAPPAA
jgi:hypothetical protein